MASFWIFLVGVLLTLGGVAAALLKLGLDAEWIASILLVVAGLALAAGSRLARRPAQPSNRE